MFKRNRTKRRRWNTLYNLNKACIVNKERKSLLSKIWDRPIISSSNKIYLHHFYSLQHYSPKSNTASKLGFPAKRTGKEKTENPILPRQKRKVRVEPAAFVLEIVSGCIRFNFGNFQNLKSRVVPHSRCLINTFETLNCAKSSAEWRAVNIYLLSEAVAGLP